MMPALIPNVKITVLYDNRCSDQLLQEGWGFSLLLEVENKKILFDTGGCPHVFFSNLEKLRISLREITHLVLSHRHWDHRAGLEDVLKKLQDATKIFLPKLFLSPFLEKQFPSLNFTRISSFQEIENNMYSLVLRGGVLLYEQALLLSTCHGLVIITGCAHPGILHILQETKNDFSTVPFIAF